ncbi:MAG: hypothetical protein ACHQIM_15925 [Sphingobacteriales bacterium]
MYLAYSAINTTDNCKHQSSIMNNDQPDNELMLRYQAYQTVCHKYSHEIAAIQQYLPGWVPKFR